MIECHESVTIVHTTRMRVSRIRDNRPLSVKVPSYILQPLAISPQSILLQGKRKQEELVGNKKKKYTSFSQVPTATILVSWLFIILVAIYSYLHACTSQLRLNVSCGMITIII